MKLSFKKFPKYNLIYKLYRDYGVLLYIKRARADKNGVQLEAEIVPEEKKQPILKFLRKIGLETEDEA
jgi:hypothetical protein